MIKVVKCSEVSEKVIYDTFTKGFSDYMIQLNMDEDFFFEHFFCIEGNKKEYSFIAYLEYEPIGIVLGGLREGEQLQTLRCGALSVLPEYRGTKAAYELMLAHESLAKELGCKQLFLEVIKGNDKGLEFYKRFGYQKVYNLYYRNLDTHTYKEKYKSKYKSIQQKVSRITIDELYGLHEKEEYHLPWQSDFPYFKKDTVNCYGLFDFGELVAGICVSHNKIYYLYVMKDYRLKGYATSLILEGLRKTDSDKLRLMHTNNHLIHSFSEHIGMELSELSQYEMYKLT